MPLPTNYNQSGTQREQRRGRVNCFRSQKKTENWQADFTGVVELEGVGWFWVNIFERTTHKGDRYLTVSIKPKPAPGGASDRRQQ